MEKLYTPKEYQLQAEQANKDGLFLYQLVKEQEYTVEVLEYEKKIVSQDVYSEDGEIIGSHEVEIDDLTKPIMVEEEIINIETGKKKTTIVQKHHTETRTKTVVELAIEPKGYYICFKDNYTNGEINPHYEDEKAQEKENLINHLTMTALDFVTYIKKAGVSDEIILQYLQSNPSVQLQLALCQNVYCGVVRQLCPIKITEELTLTDEQVVNMFKDKNKIV